jgi:hypothetical protein
MYTFFIKLLSLIFFEVNFLSEMRGNFNFIVHGKLHFNDMYHISILEKKIKIIHPYIVLEPSFDNYPKSCMNICFIYRKTI